MRKFIGVVATLLLVVAMSMTAFAAVKGNWSLDSDGTTWSFVDADGNKVTESWQKSGDKYYYLNVDGNLAKNVVVESDDNFYFVGEDGAMQTAAWVFVKKESAGDDEAAHWMYFTANGKAHKNGWKEINGNKYHFTDGYMDYGFLDANGAMIDNDNDDAFKSAVFYCGEESDGRMRKAEWVKTINNDAENGYSWLFFNNAGKKLNNCVKEINGKKYGFDTDGVMVLEWADGATPATTNVASASNYYKEESGLLKKQWYYGLKGDNSEEGWYYFGGNGVAYKGVVKKIDGKFYAFDSTGKMLTGFVNVDDDMNVLSAGTPAYNVKKSDINGYTGKYMYFCEAEGTQYEGEAAQGKVILEIEDGEIRVNFSKSKGIAEANGFKNDNGYAYFNSVLQAADEDHKYVKFTDVSTGDEYLLTQAGKICKKGTYKDSLNNVKWTVDANGVITGPVAY